MCHDKHVWSEDSLMESVFYAMQVPGIELWWSDMHSKFLTHWTILLATPIQFFKKILDT